MLLSGEGGAGLQACGKEGKAIGFSRWGTSSKLKGIAGFTSAAEAGFPTPLPAGLKACSTLTPWPLFSVAG